MTDVHRKEPGEIIEYPENWEEMKEKYLEREKEALERVLTRRKAETESELASIASKAIETRATRAASEHKPLKDHTILVEPKSEDIIELKEQLTAEISAISKRILQAEQKEPSAELKGRVSPKSPDQDLT